MGATDPDLIRRWQRGDLAAFEDLVRRCQQRVGHFLFRLTGRRDVQQAGPGLSGPG